MKYYFLLFITAIISCTSNPDQKVINKEGEKLMIHALLDSMNRYAATSNTEKYFSCYADDAVFMGTDATERWTKSEFAEWTRPYFDKGQGWAFTSIKRNIEFTEDGNTAWFDELLNTEMKICRGSGIVRKEKGEWKISQYVLSMTIPNPLIDTIIRLKAPVEDSLLARLLLSDTSDKIQKNEIRNPQ